jgi:SAM-dependent methyltransferase
MVDSSGKMKEFISGLNLSLSDSTFVGLSLGNYKGAEESLKNIYVKKAMIKQEVKLSFTYRYKTRDVVKNYPVREGVGNIQTALTEGFRAATLFTTGFDLIFENINDKKVTVRKAVATKTEVPALEHDKSKRRLIAARGKSYLTELGITDKDGNVFKSSQDKYRQINHYVELLSPLIKDLPEERIKKVADMGSGKGYLTFALYDYLLNVLQIKAELTGVEFRPEMVALCNKIAAASQFDTLHFVQGTIEDHDSADTNILIALHACDTATDDAIAKGITAKADLIVVAPCCHKQIRREIEKSKVHNELDFLTKHGIFLERQAEMVTDGIRAMILEYFGYKTKVFEFISDAHTPKNVMIVGIRSNKPLEPNEQLLQKIKASKAYFGIGYHHLERIMGI